MDANDVIVMLSDEEEQGAAENDEPPIHQQLANFRQEWQKELTEQKKGPHTSSARVWDVEGARVWDVEGNVQRVRDIEASQEEKAKILFLQGVNAEQTGQLYEAIQYYRRAVQLVPDIEFRIQHEEQKKRKPRKHLESTSSVDSSGVQDEEDDEDDLDDLVGRFQRLKARDGAICDSQMDTPVSHISSLPVELMMYIFRWVVSADLDTASLENLAMVCRGFFLCARDEEIWRLICTRIWGVNCGRPTTYGSWRNMFIERPHLRFNGCFISKASYYREGEKSMDNFYKPFHLVEYYRYVRFFPEGKVLMLTTPDEPYSVVQKLKTRNCKVQGIMGGFYRLSGDQVTMILKRKKADPPPTIYRYKRLQRQQQQQNQNEREESFQVECTVKQAGSRRCAQLCWNRYAIRTKYRGSQEENVADFELSNQRYPPMIFSRVKSYTSTADSLLE